MKAIIINRWTPTEEQQQALVRTSSMERCLICYWPASSHPARPYGSVAPMNHLPVLSVAA